jgi:proline iminopeptidase
MLPLKEHMGLIFYDQAGCGRSKERDDENYSMNQEVENLESLPQRLGFEKISLFGESWGSMLALLYVPRRRKTWSIV